MSMIAKYDIARVHYRPSGFRSRLSAGITFILDSDVGEDYFFSQYYFPLGERIYHEIYPAPATGSEGKGKASVKEPKPDRTCQRTSGLY